jgi:PAS domain S-box-containing protein
MSTDSVIDLKRGIDSGEVVPYFQPLIELRTGQLLGFEVLARWNHPVRGMVNPDEFIQLAENSGLIGPLSQRLLIQAGQAAKDLPEHLGLSINISPVQLRNRSLPRHIAEAAEMGGLSCSRLTIEITESALVQNLEQALSITEELKSLGAKLALDDFGTGYASLRYLHDLPFDEIKVDRSFVSAMLDGRDSRKIVAAIVGLGQSLGMVTVAEGVEDMAQADMLLWLGCDLGQGWLYGRPAASADLGQYTTVNATAPFKPDESGQWSASADILMDLATAPNQRLSQLRAIYDGANVGLCFLDRNLRYLSLNRRLAEINNAPIVAHLGRTVAEIVPEVFRQIGPVLHRVLDGEVVPAIEVQARDRAEPGQVRTTLRSYEPVRDEAGEVFGISVSVIDISKRKSVEEALRESEDHYRHAVELNPQVPWTADPDGMILDAGPSWQTLTGLTVEAAHGNGWINGVHPDDIEGATTVWTQSIRTGQPIDIEFRIGPADGPWRWMRSRAAARRGPHDEIVRWYGTLEDIDDQKKAQAALKQSDARLNAVLETAPMGIVIADAATGRVLIENASAQAILRQYLLPAPNMQSYRQWLTLHPEGLAPNAHEWLLAYAKLRGPTPGATELAYLRGDGTVGRLSLTTAQVLGHGGTATEGVMTIRDIDIATPTRH